MVSIVGEVQRPVAGRGMDTVRALLHDLRQPLAAILLMAGAEGGDDRRKLDVIAGQARWLAELVEVGLSDAANDDVASIEVAEVVQDAVERAQATTTCTISVLAAPEVRAWARPVALSRALGCVIDNAVRAAGEDGHVAVEVFEDLEGVHVRVTDDGPGLGHVESRTSLGLTTVRAMVAACDGAFTIRNGEQHGAVADICLAGTGLRAVAL